MLTKANLFSILLSFGVHALLFITWPIGEVHYPEFGHGQAGLKVRVVSSRIGNDAKASVVESKRKKGKKASAKKTSLADAGGGVIGGEVDPNDYNLAPEYPALSRMYGEEGKVKVRVHLDDVGKTERIEIVESSGYTRLDESVLTSLRAVDLSMNLSRKFLDMVFEFKLQ